MPAGPGRGSVVRFSRPRSTSGRKSNSSEQDPNQTLKQAKHQCPRGARKLTVMHTVVSLVAAQCRPPKGRLRPCCAHCSGPASAHALARYLPLRHGWASRLGHYTASLSCAWGAVAGSGRPLFSLSSRPPVDAPSRRPMECAPIWANRALQFPKPLQYLIGYASMT